MVEIEMKEWEMTNPIEPTFGGEHLRDIAGAAADDAVAGADGGIFEDLADLIAGFFEWLF
ncbi:hypothetical protein WEH80_40665 [Actinomycetes bacterium KLBMP 9759]